MRFLPATVSILGSWFGTSSVQAIAESRDPFFPRPEILSEPCPLAIKAPDDTRPPLRAFREMDPRRVEWIVIRPSVMPRNWSPRDVQAWAMERQGACDVGFHFGFFPYATDESEDLMAMELRDLRYQGAFDRGENNNIGVLFHGVSPEAAEKGMDQLVEYILGSGRYPRLRGVSTHLSNAPFELEREAARLNKKYF